MNGRNFEYLGEDPWLASRLVVSYVEGIQSLNVSATIKHFVGNNSEFARHTSDSTIDERTLREIYLPAFEAAVKEAHIGSVMSSYNLLNGQRATANPHLVHDILKGDWGFRGVFMSDWGATYDGVAAANAGLDLEMPNGRFMNAQTLCRRCTAGRQRIRHRRQSPPPVELASPLWMAGRATRGSVRPPLQPGGQGGRAQGRARERGAAEKRRICCRSTPSRIHTIAVIGPNAYPAVTQGGGSAHVASFEPVSVLQGLSDKFGTTKTVTYAQGVPTLRTLALRTVFTIERGGKKNGVTLESFPDATFSGPPRCRITEPSFAAGAAGFGGDPDLLTLADSLPPERAAQLLAPLTDAADGRTFERWTGWYEASGLGPYTIFVQDTGGYRLLIDDEVVIDSAQIPKAILRQTRRELSPGPHKVVLEQMAGPDVGRVFMRVGIVKQGELVERQAKQLAAKADLVVVPVGFDADIESEGGDREFALPPGQNELIEAVAAANPNTLVVINAGGSVDVEPWIGSVKAVIQAWYPGQESGAALADLLTGDADPSGRLPISWERAITDDPTFANYYYNDPMHPDRIVYREGVFVGYRGFEHTGTHPLFPFGFGLSYTSFKYSDFTVKPASGDGPDHYTVTFNVTNTGARAGADVAQVYVGARSPRVPRPLRELKAFQRVELEPGETKPVTLTLNARSFAYYDVKSSRWRADAGSIEWSWDAPARTSRRARLSNYGTRCGSRRATDSAPLAPATSGPGIPPA